MKKITQSIQLMLLTVALFSSALLAQQNLGTSNKYKIGTSDSPVLAPEYTNFLNAQSPSDHPWIESGYYDSSFMNASNNWSWQNNLNAAIYRTGTSGNYSYSVISGHENDIIDAVYSQSIQQEFNAWRAAKAAELAKNPTRQELCDYINDKIAGQLDPSYLDKATEIQNRYPQAAVYITGTLNYDNKGVVSLANISLWQQVDDLVNNGIYGTDQEDSTLRVDKKGNAYTTITHSSASDGSINNFINRWGLAVSEDQDSNFPANMPKHIVMMDKNDPEQHAAWGGLSPSYFGTPGVNAFYGCFIQIDVNVTTKIPCNPPAPDNSGTPTAEAPVTQN